MKNIPVGFRASLMICLTALVGFQIEHPELRFLITFMLTATWIIGMFVDDRNVEKEELKEAERRVTESIRALNKAATIAFEKNKASGSADQAAIDAFAKSLKKRYPAKEDDHDIPTA